MHITKKVSVRFSSLIFCTCVSVWLPEETLKLALNPLSPESDQHEISLSSINAFLNRVVMRIEGMISQDESY